VTKYLICPVSLLARQKAEVDFLPKIFISCLEGKDALFQHFRAPSTSRRPTSFACLVTREKVDLIREIAQVYLRTHLEKA
jgi:hypothetical protein